MKEFTLELADNDKFDNAETVTTDPKGEITPTADGGKSQTRSFKPIEYELNQLDKLASDSTGRGASKTSRTMCARKLTVRCSRTINMTSLSIDLTSR